jgi:hypothetical protein
VLLDHQTIDTGVPQTHGEQQANGTPTHHQHRHFEGRAHAGKVAHGQHPL